MAQGLASRNNSREVNVVGIDGADTCAVVARKDLKAGPDLARLGTQDSMVIMHVEDDPDLSEVVELAFRSFGFRGTFLRASTVVRAYEMFDEVATLDLVITDMQLPDGTGLHVVRRLRDHPVWGRTPILVLSGEVPSESAARAYALGANAYVPKSVRGRSVHEVVRSLYQHWMTDAVLPPSGNALERFISTAARIRERYASFDLQLATRFPEDADFWLARALTVANAANLMRFFGRQLLQEPRTLQDALLRECLSVQRSNERMLTEVERALERTPVMSRDDACRLYARLFEPVQFNYDAYARLILELVPLSSFATVALSAALAEDLEQGAAWIEAHAPAQELHAQVARMRGGAATYRSMSALAPAVAATTISYGSARKP